MFFIPSVCTRIQDAVMSVVMLKYGSHISFGKDSQNREERKKKHKFKKKALLKNINRLSAFWILLSPGKHSVFMKTAECSYRNKRPELLFKKGWGDKEKPAHVFLPQSVCLWKQYWWHCWRRPLRTWRSPGRSGLESSWTLSSSPAQWQTGNPLYFFSWWVMVSHDEQEYLALH